MEDWNGVKARKGHSRWRLMAELAVVLVLGLVLLRLVLPRYHAHDASPAGGDPRAMELARLKMLGHALKLHAEEHGGKFPAAIADIEWRQNLPGMDWAGLPAAVSRFHNPETGKVSDWLYYQGHTESDPPQTLLAAAPVALGKGRDRRMVLRVDGVAEIIAEADFLRPLGDPGRRDNLCSYLDLAAKGAKDEGRIMIFGSVLIRRSGMWEAGAPISKLCHPERSVTQSKDLIRGTNFASTSAPGINPRLPLFWSSEMPRPSWYPG